MFPAIKKEDRAFAFVAPGPSEEPEPSRNDDVKGIGGSAFFINDIAPFETDHTGPLFDQGLLFGSQRGKERDRFEERSPLAVELTFFAEEREIHRVFIGKKRDSLI